MYKSTLCGLMSGSSLDGLDLAVVEFNRNQENNIEWDILYLDVFDFPDQLKENLKKSGRLPIADFLAVEAEFSRWCGNTVKNLPKDIYNQVDAVSIHGHTTTHLPSSGFSNQLTNGWQLAAISGKKVISDFRNNDIAHGGQGAPLAPVCEKYLFPEHRIFLNLGGIANISLHTNDNIIGYDICPFNQVLNYLANSAGLPYDDKGKLAETGEIDVDLASAIRRSPFFSLPYPKSLDNSWISGNILPLIDACNIHIADKMRTVVHVFTELIAKEIIHLNKLSGDNVSTFVTGGGTWNTFAISNINARLADAAVPGITIPQREIVNGKEAILMALLGYLKLQGIPNSFSSVTGAEKDTINGTIYES